MNAKTWVDILFIYGPFAILIFLVFVVERRIYSRWRAANQDNKKEQTAFLGLYGFTWLMIFGVAVYSIYAWKKINLDERPKIAGEIQNLSNLETLGTTSADLYLNKIPRSGRFSDYRVLLVKSDNKRWRDGEPVRFTIQTPARPGNMDGDLFEYYLPIRSDFYENGVMLTRSEDKFLFYDGGKWTELSGRKVPGSAEPTVSEPPAQSQKLWDIVPTAYAQANQDYQQMKQSTPISDFAIGLESPDAVVRRKTRADLARQNPIAAVPWIQDVLDEPKSSYRLRLGVLAALNQMPGVRADSLRGTTITVIQTMLCDVDDSLRNEAYSFLQKLKLMPVVLYEHADSTGKSQGFGPCKYRADKGQFWKLPNDSASSVKVEKGYSVRVCENEGAEGRGAGRCETYREGIRNLTTLSDRVSFVEVTKYEPTQQRAVRRR
ncbi:MAG: hypothetical protein ACT4OT_03145 [Acidobacteriota bacterium]